MSLDELIKNNTTLSVISLVIIGGISGFGLCEKVRVEGKNNEITLLKNSIEDLRYSLSGKDDDIKSMKDEVQPLRNNLSKLQSENKELESKVAAYDDNIKQWSKALDEWKNAYNSTNLALKNCSANANVLDTIRDVEQKKTNVELSLQAAMENPLEQERIPHYQRLALEYQTRILELEKKLMPQQK
ncbi:hypothetical protein V1481_01290 [Aeromonas enteropelogenes]|uniref:hypothetical protein n=1 Tax=Aeromonas enteropelogenes TaxID=29489 RepID=UPI0031364F06